MGVDQTRVARVATRVALKLRSLHIQPFPFVSLLTLRGHSIQSNVPPVSEGKP